MATDPEEGEKRGLDEGADVSDLVGVKLTLVLVLWFLIVLGCFFFVGPVAGIVAIIGGIVIGAIMTVAVIRRADTTG